MWRPTLYLAPLLQTYEVFQVVTAWQCVVFLVIFISIHNFEATFFSSTPSCRSTFLALCGDYWGITCQIFIDVLFAIDGYPRKNSSEHLNVHESKLTEQYFSHPETKDLDQSYKNYDNSRTFYRFRILQ
jgi:hypothetical protein